MTAPKKKTSKVLASYYLSRNRYRFFYLPAIAVIIFTSLVDEEGNLVAASAFDSFWLIGISSILCIGFGEFVYVNYLRKLTSVHVTKDSVYTYGVQGKKVKIALEDLLGPFEAGVPLIKRYTLMDSQHGGRNIVFTSLTEGAEELSDKIREMIATSDTKSVSNPVKKPDAKPKPKPATKPTK